MDKFNGDLQKKYNDLKKRKLIQLDRNSELEKKVYELVSATEDMLRHEGKKSDHMFEKLLFWHDKLAEKEQLELEQTKRMKNLSSEVTRLQDLVLQKNEATINIEMMRRQPPTAEVSEEDNASQKEPVNQSCRRCTTDDHGDQVMRDSISDKLLTLVESIHGMNISFGQQSAEVVHEKSGYAFTLTWSIDEDELVYHVSSLGTLENIASKWMKEEIFFNIDMCPMFFQKICSVIGRA
ncbi:titan9 isoform X2 [Carex rostrata]